MRSVNAKIKQCVSAVNRAHSTHFAFGPTDAFGDNRKAVLFDPRARKVLFYWDGECSLQDYRYIQGWELNWTERSGHNYSKAIKVFMRIKTIDVARPVIDIPMRSKAYGDVWQQRLGLILNASA
jgi:hypothetical protein